MGTQMICELVPSVFFVREGCGCMWSFGGCLVVSAGKGRR